MAKNICIKESQVLDFPYEKVLWENPNPTANFTASNLPLMQSVYNFDKIRIYWKVSTTIEVESYIDIEKSQFNLIQDAASSIKICIAGRNTGSTNYYRYCRISEDSVYFGTGKQYNTTTTAENYCIPTKVTGINKVDIPIPSRGDENIEVLWVNPSPNAALASGTAITLTNGLENYDIVRIFHKPTASSAVETWRWSDIYIGKDPSKYTATGNNVRMVIGDLISGTLYVRNLYPSDTIAPYTTITFGNGDRVANTTTNTSNTIPVIICGVNYIEGTNERISNIFTVSSTGWSEETIPFGEEACYYNDINIIQFDGQTPVVSIVSDQPIITRTEQLAYNEWTFATVNTDTMKLRLYSPTLPTNNFMIKVEGVR